MRCQSDCESRTRKAWKSTIIWAVNLSSRRRNPDIARNHCRCFSQFGDRVFISQTLVGFLCFQQPGQFKSKRLFTPSGIESQLVVGDHECASLSSDRCPTRSPGLHSCQTYGQPGDARDWRSRRRRRAPKWGWSTGIQEWMPRLERSARLYMCAGC